MTLEPATSDQSPPAASPRSDRPLYDAPPWEAYRRFWQRFAVFSGRAGRAEYWWPVLLNVLAVIALAVLVAVVAGIGAALSEAGSPITAVTNALIGVLGLILALLLLAQIVPSVSIAVRRLHDVDLSGWLVLIALVPSVGGIALAVLHVLPANPRGQQYDRGAEPEPSWRPTAALRAPEAVEAAPAGPVFDTFAPAAPATAPILLDDQQADEAAQEGPLLARGDGALRAAWSGIGEVAAVEPPMWAPPAWRRQGYLLVSRADGTGLLATDGLSGSEGVAVLGAGAEVHLAGGSLHAADVAERWELAAVAAVARRIAASGMHVPSELEQYGTLSMTLPAIPAPEGLRTADGGLGVLIGLPTPGVPDTVATAGGEVRLASITPLTPDELQQILDGGAEARARIAGRLASLPPGELLRRA